MVIDTRLPLFAEEGLTMTYDQITSLTGTVPVLLLIASIGAVYVYELICDGKRSHEGSR